MTVPTLTPPPTPAPNRGMTPSAFSAAADAHVAWQSTNVSEMQTAVTFVDAESTAAEAAAITATTQASNASNSATLASQWATTTGAQVAATDYSAKEYAIGTTVPAGSAKEWATTTGATVDGAEYAAKEWASGTVAASSKKWATTTGSTVDGSEYSAKEYATGTTVPTGSAKKHADDALAYKTGAEVAAAAAQAAAGLPSLAGNAGKSLAVNGTETGVEWASPLPSLSGNALKALRVNAGETTAEWASVGQVYRTTRTSNTIITAADMGNLIDITGGTFTQTFAAAATLGNGWWCYIRNSGTGDITLDPNGAETIDGLTSFVMYPSEVRLIQCDGTGFNSVVLNAFAKTFTTSGTFTKPPGYSLFSGRIYGAGGGGGKPADASGNGGGGGGGACVPFHVPSDVVSSSTTVTIGSGGAGATSMGATGGTGGDSTFGAFVTAYGGGGGEGGPNGGTAYGGGGGGSGSSGALFSVRGGLPSSQYLGDSQLPTLGGGGGGRLAMNQNKTSSVQGCAEWGGAGGSAGYFNSIHFGPSSIYGGGGGGGGVYNQSTRPEGGSSGKYLPGDGAGQNGDGVKAGSGGRGGSTSNLAGEAGGAPSGGGGGGGSDGSSAGNGGNGARGELRIWGIL